MAEETTQTQQTSQEAGGEQQVDTALVDAISKTVLEKLNPQDDNSVDNYPLPPIEEDDITGNDELDPDDPDDARVRRGLSKELQRNFSRSQSLVDELVRRYPHANADELRRIATDGLHLKPEVLESRLRFEAKRDAASYRNASKNLEGKLPGLIAEALKAHSKEQVREEVIAEVAKSHGSVDVGGSSATAPLNAREAMNLPQEERLEAFSDGRVAPVDLSRFKK